MRKKRIVYKPNTLHAARQISVAGRLYSSVKKYRKRDQVYNGTLMKLFETPVIDVVTIIEPPAVVMVHGPVSDYWTPFNDYVRAYIGGLAIGDYFPFRADWAYSAANTRGGYVKEDAFQLPLRSWKYMANDPTAFGREIPSVDWVKDRLEKNRFAPDTGKPSERPEEYTSLPPEIRTFIGDEPFSNPDQVTTYRFAEGVENEDPVEPYSLSWFLIYEEAYLISDRTVEVSANNAQSIQFGQEDHLRVSKYDINPDAYIQKKPFLGNSVFEVLDQNNQDAKLFYEFKFYKGGSSRTFRIYEKYVEEEFNYVFLSRGYSAFSTTFDNKQYYTDSEGNIYGGEQEGFAGEGVNCKPSAVMRGLYLELFIPVYSRTAPTFDGGDSDYNHGKLALLYLKFQIFPGPDDPPGEFPDKGWILSGSTVLDFDGTNAEQPAFPDGSGKLVPSGAEVVMKPTGNTLSGYIVTYVNDHQGQTNSLNWNYQSDLVTVYEESSEVANARVTHVAIAYLTVDGDPDETDSPTIDYKDVISWSYPYAGMGGLAQGSFSTRDFNNKGATLEVHSQPHVFVKSNARVEPEEGSAPEYKAILMMKGYQVHPTWESSGANIRQFLTDTGKSREPYAVDSGLTVAIDGETMYLSDPYPKPPEFDTLGVPIDGWGGAKMLRTCFVQSVEFCLVNSNTTRVMFYQKDRSEFLTRSVITPSANQQEVDGNPDDYTGPAFTQPAYPWGVFRGIAYKKDVPKYFTYEDGDRDPAFEDTPFEDVVTNNHLYGVTVGAVREEYFDEGLNDFVPPIVLMSYWEADYVKFELFEPDPPGSPDDFIDTITDGGSGKVYETENNGAFIVPPIQDYLFILPTVTNVIKPQCYLLRTGEVEAGEEPAVEKLLVGEFYGLAISYRGNGLPRLR